MYRILALMAMVHLTLPPDYNIQGDHIKSQNVYAYI